MGGHRDHGAALRLVGLDDGADDAWHLVVQALDANAGRERQVLEARLDLARVRRGASVMFLDVLGPSRVRPYVRRRALHGLGHEVGDGSTELMGELDTLVQDAIGQFTANDRDDQTLVRRTLSLGLPMPWGALLERPRSFLTAARTRENRGGIKQLMRLSRSLDAG